MRLIEISLNGPVPATKDDAYAVGTRVHRLLGSDNLLAYAAMVLDKSKARHGTSRIRESTLLNLALIGGSFGTVVAQQTIRHKTRKEPFRSRLRSIILLQALVIIALALALIISGSPQALWARIEWFG